MDFISHIWAFEGTKENNQERIYTLQDRIMLLTLRGLNRFKMALIELWTLSIIHKKSNKFLAGDLSWVTYFGCFYIEIFFLFQ